MMKLILDQNLSFKLVTLLADIFPDSASMWESADGSRRTHPPGQ
jgi:hypothetical protein